MASEDITCTLIAMQRNANAIFPKLRRSMGVTPKRSHMNGCTLNIAKMDVGLILCHAIDYCEVLELLELEDKPEIIRICPGFIRYK